ncbi:uncharacterized protein RHOBADRAFT_44299 [Rhodotorula graminis WP1]|uniref:Fumarylacetoacetase n=1 Tax=Rhodotorula graminis (strain WP1) TaxID=578459 RepID=A0A194S2P4_RHOGW|nr:uncharacterized protein RHOBADRAFT_44299 [Rhodotorula graminis WP1]KPV74780.1 hypothetical protein RHOBADRAFT_44299 [Rhodotorula graminis WP1]
MASPWPLAIPTDSHFSLNNVPFGVVSRRQDGAPRVCATRIGDHVVDLSLLEAEGLLDDALGGGDSSSQRRVFDQPTLNAFAALPVETRNAVRLAVQTLLSPASSTLRDNAQLRERAILPLDAVTPHSRSRSPTLSTTRSSPPTPSAPAEPFSGQVRAFSPGREVSIGASKALDWEFEIGAFVANSTPSGSTLSPSSAQSHIFGYVLLNDWSARDIQSLEMVPLGPFNGKSFATTVSPWVVLPAALEPFEVDKEVAPELEGNEAPEYLREKAGVKSAYDLECTTRLRTSSDPSTAAHLISTANFRAAHWSFAQLVAYQTFSGARLQTGDLLGSGTVSNHGERRQGCLLELAKGGKEPLELELGGGGGGGAGGERRAWLEDGDEVVFCARAGPQGSGVGFGELRGKVLPVSALRAA